MGNTQTFWIRFLMVLILMPSHIFAQPIEESDLPPVAVPEMEIEIIDPTQDQVDPFPTESAPAVQETQIITPIAPQNNALITPVEPVAQPQAQVEKVESAAGEDDGTLKNVTLSPSFTLQPAATMGKNAFFSHFEPGLGIETNMKTGQGRKVSLGASYSFVWEEFLNQRESNNIRYFEHNVAGSFGVDWNDVVSTAIDGGFGYYISLGTDSHEVDSANQAMMNFKINPMVSAGIGYGLYFYNNVGSSITRDNFNLPSDSDDIFVNNISQGQTGFSDPFGFSGSSVDDNSWFANHSIKTKTSIKATDTTKVSLGYDYVFATGANDLNSVWRGHYILAGVSQGTPWGANVGLTSQLRLRNYVNATNSNGSAASNWRSRTWLTYSQPITEFCLQILWYRLEASGKNDGTGKTTTLNQLRIGLTVNF
ncbi:MAG: hypothetical protein R3A11_08995 [Bdellovibrionota bacterium]